jgi:glyoxylase-like metal-dependent hydrolase (beta-lactamase superfamily II)
VKYDWVSPAAGVYQGRLPFLDVTVGVVSGPAGVLLIDCGTTLSETSAVADDILELTGAAVTHLVMTHHHFDHILGSAGFPEARTYAAPPVATALTTGLGGVRAYALSYGAHPDEVDRAITAARAPDHVVWNTTIDLGDRVVAVEHPGRGHTDHDLVVVVPPSSPADRTVVFCGDLIEESADPAVDDGSDLGAWPSTLDRLLHLGGEQAIYVPGHGAAVDAAFVRDQRDWLAAQT